MNQQHIKKQKLSEADIIFGSMAQDSQEQMEIGELGNFLFYHKLSCIFIFQDFFNNKIIFELDI